MWLTYPSSSQLISQIELRYRIINLFVIAYAFQPQLRFRLTLGGLSLPRNPWVYGGRGFNSSYRYSCQHNLSMGLQQALPVCLLRRHRCSPTPQTCVCSQSFGIVLEPRYIVGAEFLDE